MPSSRLLIDCQALEERFHALGRTIMPMVKGNGYGLGAFELASFYDRLGVPFVGVAHVEEAIHLRERGYTSPIFALTCSDPKWASIYNITLALNSLDEAKRLHTIGRKVDVHLQLDLGLNRLGFTREEAYAALPFIHQSPYLNLEGVMSHFGSGGVAEAVEFEEFVRVLRPKWVHMASTKSINESLPSCNMVRLGFGLFCGLTLESYVIGLKRCPAGARVGYIGEYVQRERMLAILSIGYHDGLHLAYSGKGYVLFGEQRAPYIANIYMDFLTVDVTGIDVQVGDRAEIFGPQLPLEEVARCGAVNPRQLLCCLGPRVKREYVNIRESLGTGKAHCAT